MPGAGMGALRRGRWLAIILLSLAACSSESLSDAFYGRPREPRFAGVTVTPVAPDLARIYFYREWEPYESNGRPWIYLNGERGGVSIPGAVYYRDVPAGEYHITIDSRGTYPGQFKTILLKPGETRYIKVESLRTWYRGFTYEYDTFVIAVVGERQGRREAGDLRYVTSARS